MWIVRLALARPYTFIVMAMVVFLLFCVVIPRTPTDIFPDINIPVIALVWNYAGLQPQEMEQRITSGVERGITTLVNDMEHIESQSLNGIAVIKIFFQPNANIQTALAQTTAISQTFLRSLPPGTTPPLVIIYSASTVPVLQIGLTSDRLSEQQLFDLGNNFIRVQLATVQGAASPFPFGGKQRLISVDIDSTSLQAKGLSAVDIVNAVNAQNLILPTGTAKLGALEFNVEMNGSPRTVAELNDLPVKTINGSTIYMRDVAHVRDGFSPQTNVVLANGQRGVLMSVYKTGNASTLSIVDRVKQTLHDYGPSLPRDLKVTTFFDQSLFVRAAIQGVLREAIIAACLTAVMILLFLGNWKSTFIIATSIPLSILVSLLCLSALGETINIMTLGGLALAVGILVDDATVEIENINRKLAIGKETVQAILDGAQQIAVPAFVSTVMHLHRLHPHVLPLRRRQIPLRPSRRSRHLRHARFLHVVAHHRAHHGHVPLDRPRTSTTLICMPAKNWVFSGATSRDLSAASSVSAPPIAAPWLPHLHHGPALLHVLPGLLRPFRGTHLPRPRLLPQR